MKKNARGFTLIELLVVVTIIAVLVALLLPLVHTVRFNARLTVTGQRLAEISQRASQAAVVNRSLSGSLQAAGLLPGASRVVPNAAGRLIAAAGAWLPYDQTWHQRFPLGSPVLTHDTSGRIMRGHPLDNDLGGFDPSWAPDFLAFLTIAPNAGKVRSDRSPGANWNDAWGNALIVARSLYQYGPDTATSWPTGTPDAKQEPLAGTVDFDTAWQQVVDTYGQSRQLYIVCAAVGLKVADANANLALASSWNARWAEVRADADVDSAVAGQPLWRIRYPAIAVQDTVPAEPTTATNAVRSPPWKGQRRWKMDGRARILGDLQILP